MLEGREQAFLVFGVRDQDREIVGTDIGLTSRQIGNEDFELSLSKKLDPRINVRFHKSSINGVDVELIIIEPSFQRPVKFDGEAYVRIGSNQQPLSNHPERERTLWQITSRFSFETSWVPETYMSASEIKNNYYLRQLGAKIDVENLAEDALFRRLEAEGLISRKLGSGYSIANLLGVACAKDLSSLPGLRGKGTRLIVYEGTDKAHAKSDLQGDEGHLVTFESLLDRIMDSIPSEENLVHGMRRKSFAIPSVAIREFLANALSHQDFMTSEGGPVIEMFEDRAVISNPGEPLISIDRFIDSPSRSRNPRFAKLMRDAGYCEQRGSGVDRAIRAVELEALPPPLITTVEGYTVVTI